MDSSAAKCRNTLLIATVSLALALSLSVVSSSLAQSVSPSTGSFSQAIAIDVPAVRGLQPRLVLGYSSQGGGAFAGVGWGLGGFSTIERLGAGLGTPRFDSTDVYVLDGRELVACAAGSPSPSCVVQGGAAGSFTTKDEAYIKVKFDSATNTWTVWQRDGSRTVFTQTYPPSPAPAANTVTWGQTSVVDTHANTATYAWACDGSGSTALDCYPSSVSYSPYQVTIYRELRTDIMTSAVGLANLRQTRYRLKSILVKHTSSGNIRAYKLQYAMSAATSRSRLISVQQYGTDVTIDSQGAITAGTTLPAQTFQYLDDSGARSFQPQPAQ